jgi:hypothetical protein
VNFSVSTALLSYFAGAFGVAKTKCSIATAAPTAAPSPAWADASAYAGGITTSPTFGPSETGDDRHACSYALGATFFVGAGLILLSFLACVCFVILDRKDEREARAELAAMASAERRTTGPFITPAESKPKKVVRFSDVRHLPAVYWLLCLLITLFYNCIFPFLADAKKFFVHDWHVSNDAAAPIAGLLYTVSMVVSPFLGSAIDYFGRRGQLAIGACFVTEWSLAEPPAHRTHPHMPSPTYAHARTHHRTHRRSACGSLSPLRYRSPTLSSRPIKQSNAKRPRRGYILSCELAMRRRRRAAGAVAFRVLRVRMRCLRVAEREHDGLLCAWWTGTHGSLTFLMLVPWDGWAPNTCPGDAGCALWHSILPMLLIGLCYCICAGQMWNRSRSGVCTMKTQAAEEERRTINPEAGPANGSRTSSWGGGAWCMGSGELTVHAAEPGHQLLRLSVLLKHKLELLLLCQLHQLLAPGLMVAAAQPLH